MLIRGLRSVLVGLCFAVPFGLLAGATAQAQTALPEPEPAQNNCEGCHEIIQTHWQDSAHANSINDPIFQEAWNNQDRPRECYACHTTGFDEASGTWQAESVSCSVCHSPDPGDHPEEMMPTDISSRLCGQCHLDSHAEWQESGHAQEDLACVRCHSPHTTGLRADGVQALCQSCHNEEAHFFDYTGHAAAGLLCSDCHLRVSESEMGDGHGQRVHSFAVDLTTCSQCHSETMHYPSEPAAAEESTAGSGGPELSQGSLEPLQTAPQPVSPVGFAVLAALVGMGFGVVLAPWLEKWKPGNSAKGQDDD